MRRMLALAPLFGALLGCSKVIGDAHATEPGHPAANPGAPSAAAPPKAEKHGHEKSAGLRYGVPFAWEVSDAEPLAKARSYLSEMLGDNALYARRGPAHFGPLAKGQSPRATVLACSDSRVQAEAWDRTPENDDFTIRNIGNQVKNARGSVEYGLEHLHTPVLFVLGHTGCGAVKAAMGKRDGLSAAIRAELESMKLPESPKAMNEKKAWAEAVIANVNLQVGFALAEFGRLVGDGSVTVVGAVYDLTNDLGRGHGRVIFVNVNGNTEPERLKAFEAALRGAPSTERPTSTGAELEAMANVREILHGARTAPGLGARASLPAQAGGAEPTSVHEPAH